MDNKYKAPLFSKIKALTKYFINDNNCSENIYLQDIFINY